MCLSGELTLLRELDKWLGVVSLPEHILKANYETHTRERESMEAYWLIWSESVLEAVLNIQWTG